MTPADTNRPNTWIECLAENDRLRAQVSEMPHEIARRTKTLMDERDSFLEEIKVLHAEYVVAECLTCDGEGEVETSVTCNYPSARDPFVPAERMEIETCPDCLGTCKEWGV